MAINEDVFIQKRSTLPKAPAMTIEKMPHEERSKGKKTRQSVEQLVDMMLETKLITNERLFHQVLHNKHVVWLYDGEREGYLLAHEKDAVLLQTRKNGFTMYMPTNPIIYRVNGENYHLLTRIDSVRAKANLERLSRVPTPILSAARVNDCIVAMVVRFYETYIIDLQTQMLEKTENYYKQLYSQRFAQQELADLLAFIETINEHHMNWHPRGNGHEQLVTYVTGLTLLNHKVGHKIAGIENTNFELAAAYA